MTDITAWQDLDRPRRQGDESPHAVTPRRPGPGRHPVPDIPAPPDCREMIRGGALLAVSSSGGKDSQAMTILLSRFVPREQMIVVHAPLAEVEWPGTIEHIESTIPSGVPVIMAPVASGKTLLERVEERGCGLRSQRGGAPKLSHAPSMSVKCLAPFIQHGATM